MKAFLIILFSILSLVGYSQNCNLTAQFPARTGSNFINLKSVSPYGVDKQIWVYSVKSGRPEPSFIFFHNPCVIVYEVGIKRGNTLIHRSFVDHRNTPDPLLNECGWKLEFYSDSIYIITEGQYDTKSVFVSMKYGQFLQTDTICGPDCSILNVEDITLVCLDDEFIQLKSRSSDIFELKSSRDKFNWQTLGLLKSNSVIRIPNLSPGWWYFIATNYKLESNMIGIEIKKLRNFYSIDELGRRTLNDQRSIKPHIDFWNRD